MEDAQIGQYILGIDLGTNSLGWAIIGLIDGEPAKLARAGVRIFEAGVDQSKGVGNEESRNKVRRDARSRRRQTRRRARRLRKVFNVLQRQGLLPPGDASSSGARQRLLNDLDCRIASSPWFASKRSSGRHPEPDQALPYILRAAALDEDLEPHFLGRALYHLAQRRGFLSNRNHAPRSGDDEGAVKEGIAELRRDMAGAGSRTLGEHFAGLAPSVKRIRTRWTARDMYEREFESIWAAQAPRHKDILTSAFKEGLRRAIFFQRPLRFDPCAVGRCELERTQRRAPAYLLASQRFRLLQTVNNLKVIPPGETEVSLTPRDRQKLIEALELSGDLAFGKIRRLLGLVKDYGFNLERGGEKRIPGNRTSADFHDALGEPWVSMAEGERERLVEYVHGFQNAEKLAAAARMKWDLSDDAADKLSRISLEPDHLSLSRKAVEKLLPLLEAGVPYGEARKKVYPEAFEGREPAGSLPPVSEALPEIRNPSVMRSLSELRKVVNAAVRAYGRPEQIRVELARDLKKSKKQRQAIAQGNRRNEAARADAAKRIVKSLGGGEPRPDDIRKVLLADECRWVCPYTGKPISMEALLGPDAQFDIEHIIPFSRSMDSSFQNLTLCQVEENRAAKGNRTPYEAYSSSPERYEQILDRVKRFAGESHVRSAKLKRFMMRDDELERFLEDFRSRQLNDTAYASRLAGGYLGLLYGGVSDAAGNRRVQATSGQATAFFRSLWQLNSVLNDGPTSRGGFVPKSRDDHRHHAVDALVIGLTDAAMIKRLADAAQRAPAEHRRRFASLQAPWPNFVDSVRVGVTHVVTSHRVSRKVRGALHEETIYSPPDGDGLVHVRKPLNALTAGEVADIVDHHVRELVLGRLNELGGDPKKVFADEANLPRLSAAGGRPIPIKRVRVRKAVPAIPVGRGPVPRYVNSGSNHHVEIFARLDEQGREKGWEGRVVSTLEACRRVRLHIPVVEHDHGPNARFQFSLAPGEAIECDGRDGNREIFITRKASQLSSGQLQIGFAPANDSRRAKEIQSAKAWLWANPDTLRRRRPRKVVLSPLGEVREARD